MTEAIEREQIRMSVKAVAYAIEDMLDNEGTHLFYSGGVPREHMLDVVIRLQKIYRGRVLISRTPGGIVAHKSE
jgi:hypothetical protein